ncbi:DUF5789 family protein [Halorarius litoreus]|uniref:DUF5789 family protein n=1 Tax=Halorarius litoreus TaxID=2962676 RepID=UPI0020CE5165|nr:hypothetical protein [Halorarius litoreus]
MGSNDQPTATPEEESGDSRELGVDIGALADELETLSYPTTTDELLEAYGDAELEFSGTTRTLREVLDVQGLDDEEYESAEEVRQMIYNFVGDEAVGREGYSDRGGTAGDETDESL